MDFGTLEQALLITLDDSGKEIKGDMLSFPFFPESLSDAKAVTWSSKEYPGGSMPLYQYVGSGERTFSMTAKLIRETRDINCSSFNIDINKAILWLRSRLYPKYTGGVVEAPPVMNLYMGGYSFYNNQICIPVILTECGVEIEKWWDKTTEGVIEFTSKGISGESDGDPAPKFATVSLGFTEIQNYGGKVNVPQRNRHWFGPDYSKIKRVG